jgi:hypothetical protein
LSRFSRFFLVLALSSPLLAGCGSIQVVDHTPAGGTVALTGSHDSAEEKAEDYMRAACPFGYHVVDESETAIRFRCKVAQTWPATGPRA